MSLLVDSTLKVSLILGAATAVLSKIKARPRRAALFAGPSRTWNPDQMAGSVICHASATAARVTTRDAR